MNDVKLNTTSALVRGLELPLRIAAAYVQSLKIKVSWANLLSAPIRVEVSGLYVVCSPDKEVLGSDRLEAELASIDAVVQALADLAAGPRTTGTATATASDPSVLPAATRAQGARCSPSRPLTALGATLLPLPLRAGKSTVMRILSRVSDLVEVAVSDVHVRFEVPAAAAVGTGPAAAAAAPAFSLGVCLSQLGIFSTDAHGARVSAGAAAGAGGDNMSYVRKTLEARLG